MKNCVWRNIPEDTILHTRNIGDIRWNTARDACLRDFSVCLGKFHGVAIHMQEFNQNVLINGKYLAYEYC
jgi:hypothetical protein